MSRHHWFLSLALLAICCQVAVAAPTITVLGDSMSAGTGGEWYPNWHTQLVLDRGLSVNNYAVGGAVASGVLYSQLPSALPGIDPGDYVVVMIGGNDAVDAAYAYFGGSSASAVLNIAVANIESTVLQLKSAGAYPILANIPDVTATPVAQSLGSAAQRAVVSAAIADANVTLDAFLQTQSVPYVDIDDFVRDHGAPGTPFVLGATSIDYSSRFASDGFHPQSALHGVMANSFMSVLDEFYGETLAPLTDQDILANSGRSPTGSTSYFDVAPYVVLPPVTAPEPSTLVLASFGFMALATWGWRRKR